MMMYKDLGNWCNGSTVAFEAISVGSIPTFPAKFKDVLRYRPVNRTDLKSV